MSDFHPAGVTELSPGAIERVNEAFVKEKLLRARDKSWEVLHEIKKELKEGMTELEARKLALKVFADYGVSKHWHQPWIRFGSGTVLNFNHPIQQDYRLQPNDPYYLDLGPVWMDGDLAYEGDVGDAFVFGENPEAQACADAARQVFHKTAQAWAEEKLAGDEMYRRMEQHAARLGYATVEGVDGHRISDFPHQRYTKEVLSRVGFQPTPGLWILEVQLVTKDRRFGAFYEDLLVAP